MSDNLKERELSKLDNPFCVICMTSLNLMCNCHIKDIEERVRGATDEVEDK